MDIKHTLMAVCKTTETTTELEGILSLQRQNLPAVLSPEEVTSQGFLTVVHSLDELQQLNDIEPHTIAKENEQVVAYLLAMTKASENSIPILKPMFDLFRIVNFAGRKVSAFQYIVVGQVCVDRVFRGTGLLDACYAFYRKSFAHRYDFAITEIAASNLRSLQAHRRIGFNEIHRYTAPDLQEWVIVIWDWNDIGQKEGH